MTDTPTPDVEAQWRKRKLRSGCQSALLAALLLGGLAFGARSFLHQRALGQQEEQARLIFEPALHKLEEARQAATEPAPEAAAYDIDATIRVMHSVDQALTRQEPIAQTMLRLAQEDYRGVAPDALEARAEVLAVLQRQYARQLEAEDQEAMWRWSAMALQVAGILTAVDGNVDVRGGLGGGIAGTPELGGDLGLRLDRQRLEEQFGKIEATIEGHKDLQRDLAALDGELAQALMDYSEVAWGYRDEWLQLCQKRDRAYLAVGNQDWDAALAASREAMAIAPDEREAHLLAAMALIHGDLATDEDPDEALDLLEAYMARHPSHSAPALLLKGVWHYRQGDSAAATLALQEAAKEYPLQAAQLQDMLDPYEARAYLQKSTEGLWVRDSYHTMMLGAAGFSPDLWLARMQFDAGDIEGGRAQIKAHFARQRTQKDWRLLIRELEFCEEFLSPQYQFMLPERGWLDLQVEEKLMGSKLAVSVDNRSDRSLHNVTLVLCMSFTDQIDGHYEPIALPTVPELAPLGVTEFEPVEVAVDVFGELKGFDQAYETRAVLVANEAVVWVDTERFKEDLAQQQRERRAERRREQRYSPAAQVLRDDTQLVERALLDLEREGALSVSSDYGKDDVTITLPGSMGVLTPYWQLETGVTRHRPQQDLQQDGRIRLRFEDVANFDDGGPQFLQLRAETYAAELVFSWIHDDSGAWVLQPPTRSD
jgi:tetratricopeptide (TPR) repeat protein